MKLIHLSIREDFCEKYCNLEGALLYIGAVVIIAYLCWNWKSWI